ncbi:hypothetical protein ABI59_19955 [Acidobacteria bacterium Mor1]|nr:hypothetical protein ABI59_19955 [Acidobacteria bacterium Mor1]
MQDAAQIKERVFELGPEVRYIAVYRNGELELFQRESLAGASTSESDKYEELLVNPTLLTLAGQRGNIDCGGLDFLIIGYGNFYQLVLEVPEGHVSVAVERSADPIPFVERIRAVLD